MGDLAVAFGSNFGAADRQIWGSDPKLWNLLTQGKWAESVAELRAWSAHLRTNFAGSLAGRLDRDADLLQKAIDRN